MSGLYRDYTPGMDPHPMYGCHCPERHADDCAGHDPREAAGAVSDYLDEIEARAEAATYFGGESQEVADDSLTLVAALRAVLDLHRPVEVEPSDTICGECSIRLPNGRYLPTVEWPCATVRAINTAIGDDA